MKNLTKLSLSSLFAYAVIMANEASALNTWGYENAPGNVPTDIESAIMNITNYILGFIAIIATLIVIYGGVLYLTAAGNDDQISQSKKTISAGVIGVVIAGLAYALVIVVTTVILG